MFKTEQGTKEKEKRTAIVSVTVSEREAAILKRLAREQETTVSNLLYATAIKPLTR